MREHRGHRGKEILRPWLLQKPKGCRGSFLKKSFDLCAKIKTLSSFITKWITKRPYYLKTMKPSCWRFGVCFLFCICIFSKTTRTTRVVVWVTSSAWCGLASPGWGRRSTIVPPTGGPTLPSARTSTAMAIAMEWRVGPQHEVS